MKKSIISFTGLAVLIALNACGQKGPLYIEEAVAEREATSGVSEPTDPKEAETTDSDTEQPAE